MKNGATSPNAARYDAIAAHLAPWEALWGRSVFHRFGETRERVPEEWFAYGRTVPHERQLALAQGHKSPDAPESIRRWIQELREASALPRVTGTRPLPRALTRGLTPKKTHEIEAVLAYLREASPRPTRILDIGGGAGHLARHLAVALECPVTSLDRDEAVQAKGARIQETAPWRKALGHSGVRFVAGEFPSAGTDRVAAPGEWAIGLHTCGVLAWEHLALASRGYSVLGFGCCYERLDPARDLHRSRHARERSLRLNMEALILASRGGVERSLEEFLFQQRFLGFRFTLQELLRSEGCTGPRFESVGSAENAAYEGSFAGYARDRLRALEGVPSSLASLSDAALEDFRGSVEPLIEEQRFVTFLRNVLARPIELAVLLDRALWVEEQGSSSRMLEFFDSRTSPRNVGLAVSRMPQ